jgi:hypothetical protein
MNNEENHGFTSFDFITMMVSFVVIAAVTGPIIRKNIQSDQSLERARLETSQIGRSLTNPANLINLPSNNDNSDKSGRAVASINKAAVGPKIDMNAVRSHLKNGELEGKVGQDPWGNPYDFAFLRNEKGATNRVAVWSEGPDHISQTSVQRQSVGSNKSDSVEFKADDTGSVVFFR